MCLRGSWWCLRAAFRRSVCACGRDEMNLDVREIRGKIHHFKVGVCSMYCFCSRFSVFVLFGTVLRAYEANVGYLTRMTMCLVFSHFVFTQVPVVNLHILISAQFLHTGPHRLHRCACVGVHQPSKLKAFQRLKPHGWAYKRMPVPFGARRMCRAIAFAAVQLSGTTDLRSGQHHCRSLI